MDVTSHWSSGWKPEESRDYFGSCEKDDIQNYYAKWAPDYDADDEENAKYLAPASTAKEIHRLYEQDKTVKILDIGAGTGLVAIQLKSLGFDNIDALDACKEMLDISRTRNLYKNYLQTSLGKHVNPLLINDSYDVVSACAVFCPNHLNHTVFPELHRITRNEGHIIIVTRQEFIEDSDEFRGVFDREIKRYETEGKWKILTRKITDEYYDVIPGIVYVLKVTK